MAYNGTSQHNAVVSQHIEEGNSERTVTPEAQPGSLPPSPTNAWRTSLPPRAKTSMRVNSAPPPSESGVQEDQSCGSLHGRRVRFNPEVRRSTDLEHNALNPSNLISPFKTPPISVTSLGEDSESSDSYFDPQHGQGTQNEEDDISTPLPSPLPKAKRRSSRQITFEEEVRAALEGMPGEKFDGMTSEEKKNLMAMLGSYSAPVSAHTSPVPSPRVSFETGVRNGAAHQPDREFGTESLDMEKGIPTKNATPDASKDDRPRPTATTEAHKLVRAHTIRSHNYRWERKKPIKDLESGASTPAEGETGPTHEQIRAGVLSSLLKLYNHQNPMPNGQGSSTPGSPSVSGRSTPKWYNKSANSSVTSLVSLGLMGSSQTLMAAGTPGGSRAGSPTGPPTSRHKKRNSGGLSSMLHKMKHPPKPNIADEIRITIHIAKLLQRQQYVLKLCRALMLYGAPTHRLEEYVKMTCAVLEIDAQCLYIPGCMVISFDDPSTHTSDMRIVRVNQGCDLSKLHDTHLVYKAVVHDLIGVEEGTSQLEAIMKRPQKYPAWALVFVYGLASALVGPFAFQARPIDMPICFFLGCILGILQLIVAPKSDLYTNVLEISATIIMSFLARMFGSIRNGELFCFSALAQSSIALILPGYIILCGSLELQSKNLVAGSVRMFYAIIYSLFLGFGITVGATLYGALDPNATSATTCQNPMPRPWSFLFVPLFALCLLVANQARWRQAPVMVAIATAGFAVNYFAVERFASNPQVVSGLGALAIGILGNLYSRAGHGLAFAAMLPAVFVQVPSGLAAQGSIIAGIKNADALAKNYWHSEDSINSTVLNLGFSMIQISIGLTVGLFATVLLLYPFGKKRSGLFTF